MLSCKHPWWLTIGEEKSLIPGDGSADSKWVYVRADFCPHTGWLDFCMVSRHSDYIATEMCSIDQYTAYRGNGGPKNVPNYCGNSSKNHYQKQNYINTSPVNCILSKVLCINTFWKGLNTDPDSNQRSRSRSENNCISLIRGLCGVVFCF